MYANFTLNIIFAMIFKIFCFVFDDAAMPCGRATPYWINTKFAFHTTGRRHIGITQLKPFIWLGGGGIYNHHK